MPQLPNLPRIRAQPVPRIDARLKVTGEARYAADMAVSNLAYAFWSRPISLAAASNPSI
jgi:CO/xanthine dehydrogenase Mo-binding subunit